ncbi:capsule biosynthesis GfcC family protein [Escherichia coli]
MHNLRCRVGPPPSTVTLSGLSATLAISHSLPVATWRAILSGQSLLSGADRGSAWVVYPDKKHTEKAPVAYWNKRSRQAGARQHYLCWPRGLRLSETPDALNADILQILAQRIPQ